MYRRLSTIPYSVSQKSAVKKLHDLPGPKVWPLLGTVPDFVHRGGIAERFNQDVAKYNEYGMIYLVKNLSELMVVICDPRDWHQVYRKEGKYPVAGASKIWPMHKYYEMRGLTHLTLNQEGQAWKETRKKAQYGIFAYSDARKFLPVIMPVVEDFSKVAPRYANDLRKKFSLATFEMTTAVCFNRRINALNGSNTENADFATWVCNMFEDMGELAQSPNPLHKRGVSKKWFEFIANNDRISARVQEFVEKMDIVLQSGRDANPEEYDKAAQSYMGQLLQVPGISKEFCDIHMMQLMIAGVDTTAHVISWLVLNLASNQNVQERLYQELSSVLRGGNLEQSHMDESKLPFLKQCMKESTRLTPAAGQTFRMLNEDIVIRGYNIPAGTWMLYNPLGVMRDSKYFENALEFNPDRWSKEAVSKRKETTPSISEVADHTMIPMDFSWGPRMCLGARLAQMEITALIARVFQDYRVELEDPNYKFRVKSVLFNAPDPFPTFRFVPRHSL